jgi:hypothetical protein
MNDEQIKELAFRSSNLRHSGMAKEENCPFTLHFHQPVVHHSPISNYFKLIHTWF